MESIIRKLKIQDIKAQAKELESGTLTGERRSELIGRSNDSLNERRALQLALDSGEAGAGWQGRLSANALA
jgi:hypothetical protein